MTVLQKHCLLYLLGFYDGGLDGIWGPKSVAGEALFVGKYGPLDDGVVAKIRAGLLNAEEDRWSGIHWFAPEEFGCKCGCGCSVEMDRGLLQLADRVREHFGAPVTVSSGIRCESHNARVGGVANSRHLTGKAMDFCVRGKGAAEVLTYVLGLPGVRYAYAIDGTFVHMDVD